MTARPPAPCGPRRCAARPAGWTEAGAAAWAGACAATCGTTWATAAPASGAGHTGFTGTSLSVDPRTGLWAVLLTNAVHFGRGPEHSVVGLRKQVHAAAAAALLR